MKKNILFITACILIVTNNLFSQSNDKEQIKKIIIDSYIHGLIDGEDFNKAKEGIHKDFIIFGHKDSILTKKTRDGWIEQRKSRTNLEKVKYKILYVDVEDEAANAKIKLQRGSIIANDYISLYKFNSKWKIVSAIDHVKRIEK